jgi:hypothetical protein
MFNVNANAHTNVNVHTNADIIVNVNNTSQDIWMTHTFCSEPM